LEVRPQQIFQRKQLNRYSAKVSHVSADKKKTLRAVIPIAALLLLLTFGSAFMRLVADAWWYDQDAGAPISFYTPLRTRAVLFLIGSAVSYSVFFWNGKKALAGNMVFEDDRIHSFSQAIKTFHGFLRKLLKPASAVVAFIFGLSFSSLWESWLVQSYSQAFGSTDPIFHLDYSWFVFELQWRQGLAMWMLSLILVTGIAVAALYYAIPAFAQVAKLPLSIPSIQSHLSVIIGLLLLCLAAVVWYSRFSVGIIISDRFTGAGFTDLQTLGAKTILSGLLFFSALIVLVRTNFRTVAYCVGGCIAFAFLGLIAWPWFVQTYRVAPNELTTQQPYIIRALKATRFGYSLDEIEETPFDIQAEPTPKEIEAARSTLDNMRLWDPEILKLTVDNLQSLRDYYGFQDIDVDRYDVAGARRLVMVGARDLIPDRLDESRKNWQNIRLQYTHGNGIVAVPVNQAGKSGRPVFLLSDIPPRGSPDLKVDQPRIYFADTKDSVGNDLDRYVIVRSDLPEFDYSISGENEHKWTGTRGIRIDSGAARFVYSYLFGDKDLLFTNALNKDSRLLYRRNVRDRAAHILPFLKWDNDPYVALVNGRLLWIIDGYTTTDAIPYSAMALVGSTRLNYIRNSVKFTMDAYSGDWNAYVSDDNDPILKVYEKIYPGLLKPLSTAADSVRQHLRYPEDLFLLQAFQLAQYHRLGSTDTLEAQTFFRAEDAWEVPQQSQIRGDSGPMSPYYVQMRLPNEERDEFLLILPFTPRGRPNMIGWLAAHCDPEQYGRLRLFRFPRDKNINGPSQQEATFQTDIELSKQITLIGQVGSEVMHGNLLVVPVGKSVIYVKTLFLVSRQTGIRPLPELKLVVLAYSNKLVFAETYRKALELLTGAAEPRPETTERVVQGDLARKALSLLDQGQSALAAGDWARYGRVQAELKALLESAAKAPIEESPR
jgi:uncharacterized membrane protein (UPF0182 family)